MVKKGCVYHGDHVRTLGRLPVWRTVSLPILIVTIIVQHLLRVSNLEVDLQTY